MISAYKWLITLAAVFCIASCASYTKSSSPLSSQQTAINAEMRRAHDYLIQGDYEQALALYAETYGKNRDNDLRDKYLQAGNEIKNAADLSFQNADYAKAGIAYKALLNVNITSEDTGKILSFDEDYLRKQVKASAERLTEKGLTQYRQENLNEAIATWKKVLSFDPDNKSVIKAIDTANRQLRILKSIQE